MSHIPHTISRNGTFCFDRRIPKNVAAVHGPFVRLKLGFDASQVETMGVRLTGLLDDGFPSGREVDPQNVLEAMQPGKLLLSEVADEYLELKAIEPKSARSAIDALCSVAGDREISTCTREDAKAFLWLLFNRRNSTGTTRGRVAAHSRLQRLHRYERLAGIQDRRHVPVDNGSAIASENSQLRPSAKTPGGQVEQGPFKTFRTAGQKRFPAAA